MPMFDLYPRRAKSGWLSGAGTTLVLHAAIIVLLLQFQPVRSALQEAAPLMVSWITPARVVEKPQEPPKPLPVKRQVQAIKPVEPPLIAAVTEAPPPPALPQPPSPAAPPPPALVAPAPPAPPAPITPPNFQADYLHNPPPAYPAYARRSGQQGRVVLRVLVNTGGIPDKVEIRSSSGHNRLDDAALEAVQRWRFVPARQGDEPVAAWVLVPITFTLEG